MLLKSRRTGKVYFVLKVDWLKFPDGDKVPQFLGVGESAAEKEIFKKLACKYFKVGLDGVFIKNPIKDFNGGAGIEDFIFSNMIYATEGTYSFASSEKHARDIYGDDLIDTFYRRLDNV